MLQIPLTKLIEFTVGFNTKCVTYESFHPIIGIPLCFITNSLFFPLYCILMVIFSGIIMMNTKNFKSKNLKITIGLFLSVIIYYINNFFYVMGTSEKINIISSVFIPLLFFALINFIFLRNLNAK